MQRFIILAFFVATVVAVIAAPAEENKPVEANHHSTPPVTCEHMTYEGKVGAAACAAVCIHRGNAGGHCEFGDCLCYR